MAAEVAPELLEIGVIDITTPDGTAESDLSRVQLVPATNAMSRGGYTGTNVKVGDGGPAGDVTLRVYADVGKQTQLAETKFELTEVGETLSDLFSRPVPFFDGVWVSVEGSVGGINCVIIPYIAATTNNPF